MGTSLALREDGCADPVPSRGLRLRQVQRTGCPAFWRPVADVAIARSRRDRSTRPRGCALDHPSSITKVLRKHPGNHASRHIICFFSRHTGPARANLVVAVTRRCILLSPHPRRYHWLARRFPLAPEVPQFVLSLPAPPPASEMSLRSMLFPSSPAGG